jgi:hypothetical protein
MANPTSNFNWQMPTPTDLVTDLPADFEVFGQAVDSSMADLLGGTTGQVLSKTSGTDMDFTWVDTDDTNAIQNAIVDAKGDLIAASAADTPARLAVGADGETLVADSSTATGLKWAAPSAGSSNVAGKNGQINGAFDIWQRGTSVSVAASTNTTYTADRYIYNVGANQAATVSRQATGDTTNLPFVQYCARVQRNSGQTGTGTTYYISNWESVNSIPFAGKTVTLSFYARKGANYSATSDALVYKLVSGTGTDQNESTTGFTGAANVINQTATLTATWQRFSFSAAVASTATQLATEFLYTPTGTAGADDYYEVTGIQVEIASSASAFNRNAATLQGELAACQRYYQALGGQSIGIFEATNSYDGVWSLLTAMRTSPSISFTGTITGYGVASGNNPVTAVSLKSGNTVNQLVIACTGPLGAAGILASAEL